MPPRSDVTPPSSLGIIPPANRGKGVSFSNDLWLKDRQDTDGAEGFWRIHDGVYDFTKFLQNHPGGSEWLQMTKGTDITEAFEVHHLSNFPKEMLVNYFVKNAKTKRNLPFTFEENGFYKTLRREILPVLKTIPKKSYTKTDFLTDSLLILTFALSTVALKYWNFWLGIIPGILLGMLTVAAHNYFHMKDNFRMYYFQFSLMSVRDWRISHALSHHLYTNTICDLELSMVEPILQYLPVKKSFFQKVVSLIFAPLTWVAIFHAGAIKRITTSPNNHYQNLKLTDLTSFILPTFMYIFGNQSLLSTILMWNFVVIIGSFYLGFVGLNAGHHHPETFHDGDTPRAEKDWGINQLDALMDRKETTGSDLLVLTSFGDHALHHFFPTLDHGTLQHLYPVFKKVCKQFDVDLRVVSQIETLKGSFQQLIKVKPNTNPPDLKKYSKDKTL